LARTSHTGVAVQMILATTADALLVITILSMALALNTDHTKDQEKSRSNQKVDQIIYLSIFKLLTVPYKSHN